MRRIAFGAAVAAAMVAAAPGMVRSAAAAVPTIRPSGLKQQVAAHKGKVVILNLWATWCGPCVKEFPSFVQFGKANAARGVTLLTVSFDTPKSDDAKVAAFLKKSGASSGAFINAAGLDPNGYPQILEPKLPADSDFAMPRTYVFDRKGNLVRVMPGPQTAADLQKAVAPYL